MKIKELYLSPGELITLANALEEYGPATEEMAKYVRLLHKTIDHEAEEKPVICLTVY
jgi:hypothetical protein